jgi:hypothetical protein
MSQLGVFNIETDDSDCKVWEYATMNGRARRRRSEFSRFGMIPQDDRQQREGNEDSKYIPGIDIAFKKKIFWPGALKPP